MTMSSGARRHSGPTRISTGAIAPKRSSCTSSMESHPIGAGSDLHGVFERSGYRFACRKRVKTKEPFSSEVDTGSREENASKQKSRFRAKWVPVRVKKTRQNKRAVFERSGYRFACRKRVKTKEPFSSEVGTGSRVENASKPKNRFRAKWVKSGSMAPSRRLRNPSHGSHEKTPANGTACGVRCFLLTILIREKKHVGETYHGRLGRDRIAYDRCFGANPDDRLRPRHHGARGGIGFLLILVTRVNLAGVEDRRPQRLQRQQ